MIKKCKVCGKKIEVKPSVFKRKKYCSKKCFYVGRPKRKKARITRKCPNCNKLFGAKPSEVKRGRGIYCSLKCSRQRRRKKRMNKCRQCNKLFPRKNKNNHYCSRRCFTMAMKEGKVFKRTEKCWVDKNGYLCKYSGKEGKGKAVPIHRIVWENNVGEIPKNYVIHHINGIKKDNRIENLACIPRKWHHPFLIIKPYQERIKKLEQKIKGLKK